MFPYLGKMCDTGRKAGVIRQRRQFFDPECSFVKAQYGGTGCSWKRSGQMNCTAWSSKGRIDLGSKEERKLGTVPETSLYHTLIHRAPDGRSLGGWGAGWGWDGRT